MSVNRDEINEKVRSESEFVEKLTTSIANVIVGQKFRCPR